VLIHPQPPTWTLSPAPFAPALRLSWCRPQACSFFFFFFTLVTGPRRFLRLKLSDTRVYEPQIRARLGTTPHFCEVVVLGGPKSPHPTKTHQSSNVRVPPMHPESQLHAFGTQNREIRCQHAPPTLPTLHAQPRPHGSRLGTEWGLKTAPTSVRPWSPFVKRKAQKSSGGCMNRGVLLLALCILSSAPTARSFAPPIQPLRTSSRTSCAMSTIRIGIVGTVYPFLFPRHAPH